MKSNDLYLNFCFKRDQTVENKQTRMFKDIKQLCEFFKF